MDDYSDVTTTINQYNAAPGVASVTIFQGRADRCALILSPPIAGYALFTLLSPGVTAGIVLQVGATPLVLTRAMLGSAIELPVTAAGSTAGTFVYASEVYPLEGE